MPFQTIPGIPQTYALLCFDADGRERRDDKDGVAGKFSTTILRKVSADPPTDIFIYSHGWKGDIPAAIDQYNRWFRALNACANDQAHMLRSRPDFGPLHIGVHWPSLPWGDEEFVAAVSFAADSVDRIVDRYVDRLGDRPGLRDQLRIIAKEAISNPEPTTLPPVVEAAYVKLNNLLIELGSSGPTAAPGNDREPFHPDVMFHASPLTRRPTSFGLGFGDILGPLRQLSFWKMKERARVVGEGSMHVFLGQLRSAITAKSGRIHLMGHSFGCIVVSAMLAGSNDNHAIATPIHSLSLVQGALSLWSYSSAIPVLSNHPGYFEKIVQSRGVVGPIVSTRSRFDTANSDYYPIGAGVAGQVIFGPGQFPTYGALGTFGIQATKIAAVDRPMLPPNGSYEFERGQINNLEASEFIRRGDGASGAHNDIDGPEVAHAIWQAALVA